MNLDHIINPQLRIALKDLKEAIQNITLGSVEQAVVLGAGHALIENWNDHAETPEDIIDEARESLTWGHICNQ